MTREKDGSIVGSCRGGFRSTQYEELPVDADETRAVDVHECAIHASRVEGQGDVSCAIDCDQSSGSAKPADFFDYGLAGFGKSHPAIFQQRGEVMSGDHADEKFAVTGGGDSAGGVVRVGPGADDWRVADPARQLVCVSSGRSRGSKIPSLIQGHGADGAM